VPALIAKISGDVGCKQSASEPRQGARVSGRSDNHGSVKRLGTQRVFTKLTHFTTSFAHQTDHHDIRHTATRKHAQKHRLTHAGSCKDSDPLTATDGQHGVDRTYPRIKRLANWLPMERVDDRGAIEIWRFTSGWKPIKRSTVAINDSTEQSIADRQRGSRLDRNKSFAFLRWRIGWINNGAWRNAARWIDRHEVGDLTRKSDALALNPTMS